MSDRPVTDAMKNLNARLAALSKDAEAEIDKQLSDLDKLAQSVALTAEIAPDDVGLTETVNAVKKAAEQIKKQIKIARETVAPGS